MKPVTEFDREELTTLFAGWAVMGLLGQGHSVDSARSFIRDRRWLEADGSIELLVRGAVGAVTAVLGEVDAEAFLSGERLWSMFRDPAVEALLRAGMSPETGRLIEDWARDGAEAELDVAALLNHGLVRRHPKPRARAARTRRGGRGPASERSTKGGAA